MNTRTTAHGEQDGTGNHAIGSATAVQRLAPTPGTVAGPRVSPFKPGTFGARFYESIKGLSPLQLRRRERALDGVLTYTVDDECRRMVCMQAIRAALNQAGE